MPISATQLEGFTDDIPITVAWFDPTTDGPPFTQTDRHVTAMVDDGDLVLFDVVVGQLDMQLTVTVTDELLEMIKDSVRMRNEAR